MIPAPVAAATPAATPAAPRVTTAPQQQEYDAAFDLMKQGLYERVELRRTGCHGFCERGPVTVLHPKEICYLQMKPADVPEFIEKTLIGDEIVERLTYEDPQTGKRIANLTDIPFYT